MKRRYITISIKNIILVYIIALPFFQEFLIMCQLSELINKFVLLATIFVFIIFQQYYMLGKIYYWLFCDICLFVLLISAVIMSGLSIIFNLDFYAFFSLLLILMCFNEKNILLELKNMIFQYRIFLLIASIIFYIIVDLYVLTGNAYDAEGYLKGPFSLPHTLAYYCIVIYAIAFIVMKQENNTVYNWAWCLVKGLAILFCLITAVRSATLALAILVAFDYWIMDSFQKKILLFIGCGCLIVYILLFTNILSTIPVIQKTIETAAAGNVSNGRERFVSYALEYYKNTCAYQQAFGSSIEKVRNVMYQYTNIRIHAHNDFVNILVGYGYINFIIFLLFFIQLGKKTIGICGIVFFSILLYFNGLYMYAGFAQCIPIMAICFGYRKLEEKAI